MAEVEMLPPVEVHLVGVPSVGVVAVRVVVVLGGVACSVEGSRPRGR
jgi:hypothetical protein